jgi:uncharacterized OB-fold protein
MTQISLPAPQRDIESEFYWQGLARKQLLLQRCEHCQHARFPAMPGCPYCGKDGHTVIEASGRGTLYSWVVVHHAFNVALASEVPYAVGTIELAEGCRTVARLEDHQNLQPGLAFEVYYVEHSDWVEARCRRV